MRRLFIEQKKLKLI